MLGKIIGTAALWSFVMVIAYVAHNFQMLSSEGAASLIIAALIITVATWVSEDDKIGVKKIIGAIATYILATIFSYIFHEFNVLSGEGLALLIIATFIVIVIVWIHDEF